MKVALVMTALIGAFPARAMQLNNKMLKTWYSDIVQGDEQAVHSTLLQYPGAVTQMQTGMTPLHAAVNPYLAPRNRKGSVVRKGTVTAMIALLIRKKADIEATDTFSFTPLAKAARERNGEAVAALLAHGARVHVWDNCTHMTPLGYAVENDDINAALTLLHAGASRDALIKDRDEWVRIGNDHKMVCVPLTTERFLALYASESMKKLFKEFQGPALSLPEADDEDKMQVARPVKKVRIAASN